MMNDLHLVSILLLAVSSSLDNLGTGVSYGLRNICIPLSLNLVIAIVNSGGTLFSMLFGKVISEVLRPNIAGLVGAVLLIAIGSWVFIAGIRKKGPETSSESPEGTHPSKKNFFSMLSAALDDPFAAGILCTGKVRLKEGAILVAALTLSNISTGIGAGLIGFNPAITTAAVFLCSVLAISLGMNIGRHSSALMIKGIAEKASGLLLAFIGFYELVGLT
jgi:putative sporulation protein YtaF